MDNIVLKCLCEYCLHNEECKGKNILIEKSNSMTKIKCLDYEKNQKKIDSYCKSEYIVHSYLKKYEV